jgi:hypothetical protein
LGEIEGLGVKERGLLTPESASKELKQGMLRDLLEELISSIVTWYGCSPFGEAIASRYNKLLPQ